MSYSLIIHGGLGSLPNLTEKDKDNYKKSLEAILKEGERVLKEGGKSVDAVTLCVSLLEDDELYNAGRGSVLTHKKDFEFDAAVMDGINLSAGAVAGVQRIKNPVLLAKKVMENSDAVLLAGRGAEEFAEKYKDIETKDYDYFLTEKRLKQWNDAQKSGGTSLDHDEAGDKKYGTVGAVAIDDKGNLAAATSTGGLVNQLTGRVGDSPLIGAGTFADNNVCAVSLTGVGEDIIRVSVAKHIAVCMEENNMSAAEAAKAGIDYFSKKTNSTAGAIVIGKDKSCSVEYSAEKMLVGIIQKGEFKFAGVKEQ